MRNIPGSAGRTLEAVSVHTVYPVSYTHLDVYKRQVDRLVSTDRTIIIMGITEAVVFETIPVKVTINEYVEISKYFGTPNSRIFVNGILDTIILKKINEGEIVKKGRGLQDVYKRQVHSYGDCARCPDYPYASTK